MLAELADSNTWVNYLVAMVGRLGLAWCILVLAL